MKILQIGCGGIGSFYAEELFHCMIQEQVPIDLELYLSDADIVEPSQLQYQNFTEVEIGKNKATALAKRLTIDGIQVFTAIPKRIANEKSLSGFDLIILCVDNEYTRELVVRYCHEHDTNFLDLRATGRRIFAMSKTRTLSENMKFIDNHDRTEYSCQEKSDLEQGLIQKGNKIVALIGIQMTLNIFRGHGNKIISEVI
jgi:molybdopterin/thiamine biosynthesis adenylyltransferase